MGGRFGIWYTRGYRVSGGSEFGAKTISARSSRFAVVFLLRRLCRADVVLLQSTAEYPEVLRTHEMGASTLANIPIFFSVCGSHMILRKALL